MHTKPLFIVGVPRSGTSNMFNLLNLHPHIRISYEAKLITEGWQYYRKSYKTLNNRSSFYQFIETLKAFDHHERRNRWIGEALSSHETVSSLFVYYCRHSSYPELIEQIYQLPGSVYLWGNKILRIEQTLDLQTLWPDARFIILIRDPRAVYASQKKKFPFRRIICSAIQSTLHMRWARERCKDQNRYIVISYEDFVQYAADHLARILSFADVDDNASSVDSILSQRPVRADSIDKWRHALDDHEVKTIESLCYDEIIRAGYGPTRATEQKTLNVVRRSTEIALENVHRLPLNPSVWYRKQLFKRFLITVRGYK